jgi:hypothetical protein
MEESAVNEYKQKALRAGLEETFPRAKHGDVVQYQGKQYRLRAYPEQLCRSGWAVKKWGRIWDEVRPKVTSFVGSKTKRR